MARTEMSTPTKLADPIDALRAMFRADGGLVYGEQVTQLEHALQGAVLAHAAAADDELVTAVLLHDIGHLLHRDAAAALVRGEDDRHEAIGAKFLSRWFGEGVTAPVALHVQAKRYLCARDVAYLAGLSPVSRRTLELQGGPMSPDEAARFESHPQAARALALRRWDEAAKCAGAITPPLDHFLSTVVTAAALAHGTA